MHQETKFERERDVRFTQEVNVPIMRVSNNHLCNCTSMTTTATPLNFSSEYPMMQSPTLTNCCFLRVLDAVKNDIE